MTRNEDPIVTLPPHDRHGDVELKTFAVSWENNPDSLLQRFIELSNGGAGQRILILDTGFDPNNPYVKDANVVDARDFTGSRTGSRDHNGHGTFILHQMFRRLPKAEFMIAKVLGDNGSGTSSGIKNGFDWGIRGKCTWVNASLGASRAYSPMRESLLELQRLNGIFGAASGNSGRRGMGWPANWGIQYNVLPLGSYNSQFRRSSYTSWDQGILGLGAGESIVAARAQSQGLTRMSGTSMGCPNALAELIGYHCVRLGQGMADLSSTTSLDLLMRETTVDIEQPGRDIFTGYGNVVLKNTVAAMEKLIPDNPFNVGA